MNDLPQQIKIGGREVESFSYHCVNQRKEVITINSATAVASNVLAGATIDFRIDDQAHRISHVDLKLTWNNTNAVVATPEALIETVQIYSDNGSTLLYQSNYALENYLINNVQESYTEHLNSAVTRGTDANYLRTPLTLPAAAQGVWYLPIASQFWRCLHIRPYSISGNLIIRIKFATAASNIVSGTLTTPEAVLRIVHFRESEQQRKWVLSRAMLPKALWYFAPQRHVETLQLTGATQVKVKLSAIKGDVICAMIVLRPTSAIGNPSTQFSSFVLLQEYEFLNAADQSIAGYNPTVRDEAQLMYGRTIDNTFIPTVGAVFHSFSQSPKHDLLRGTVSGFERFDGFYSLRFTPVFGTAAGAYELFVLCMCSETMNITGGKVRTTRS